MHRAVQVNGAGQHLPPPGMQRVVVAQQGHPPPTQVIGPSHPSHPQHGAWLAQQQHSQHQHPHPHHLQQQQGLPQPPPASYLPQPPPPPSTHYLPQPPPLPGSIGRSQPTMYPGGSSANSVPSSPVMHAVPHPGAAGPSAGPPASLPPPGPATQGSLAPPARVIPSAAGLRPHSGAGGPPPYGASPHPPSQQQLPPRGPPGANGLPPPPHLQQQQQYHAPQMMQPRPLLRPSIAPQPNTLLAAHLALNGSGPITATAAPAGPALARLAALNDSMIAALEKENPLDALRTVIAEHFTETGVVKIGLYDKSTQMSKVFEIPCSAFPRFQHLNYLLGVLSSFMTVHFAREFRLTTPDPTVAPPSPPSPPSASTTVPPPPPPHAPPVHIGYLLRAEDATWTSRFSTGARVELVGALTMHLMFKDLGNGAAGLRIESLEFDARAFEESVVRAAMEPLPAYEAAARGADKAAAGRDKAEDESEASRPAKGGRRGAAAKRGMVTRKRSASAKVEQDDEEGAGESGAVEQDDEKKRIAGAPIEGEDDGGVEQKGSAMRVPPSAVGGFGVTELGMRCLEIAESVAQLQELIALSLETGVGPIGPQSAQPPIAASSQNPTTNSFYSSVAASPLGGPPPPIPPPGQRPPSAGGDMAASPAASAPTGAGAANGSKRKLGGVPETRGEGAGDGMAEAAASPQKIPRGAGGARGRAKGR
ncbi:hypothetical protein Rhopal_002923-T1 [Rhodotorula paludigena]|uniref:RPA43 OB domain-containing protein n=1 Tax=Rhodotorula paludigena TaxID=86838 RepID=A0AAV5GHM2_9BASI|nr:hypothetical protein Rhopal_002923-T1 [Rhodotorula paludigena]